jgi:hypothetical protein
MNIHRKILQGFHKRFGGFANFPLPGKEDENVSGRSFERLLNRLRDVSFQASRAGESNVMCCDRVALSRTVDQNCLGQEQFHSRAVECRRHDQDPEVLSQMRLCIQCQGQAQVGVDAPFVEFIEDNQSDAGEVRLMLEHACENAFGNDFDPGFTADPHITADPVADGLSDPFATPGSDEVCGSLRREASWFKQNKSFVRTEILVQQKGGNACGFPGAGSGRQDDCTCCPQRLQQFGERLFYRECVVGHGFRRSSS